MVMTRGGLSTGIWKKNPEEILSALRTERVTGTEQTQRSFMEVAVKGSTICWHMVDLP